MAPPPIQVFLTTIASQPALRRRQELLLQTLHVKKIPFTSYDLASDEEAKKLWRRKGPADKQLPGILVGGKSPGTFDQFEEAVEYGVLDIFFRLKEDYDATGDRPIMEQKVIGVPGAQSPAQMTPEHHKPRVFSDAESPLRSKEKPVNKRDDEFDVSTELSGFGLQGVMVSQDDIAALVADLGLEGDEAGDLVKGLSDGLSPINESLKESMGVKTDAENPFDSHPPPVEHPDIIPPVKRDEVLVDPKEPQEPQPTASKEEVKLKDTPDQDNKEPTTERHEDSAKPAPDVAQAKEESIQQENATETKDS